MQVHEIGRTALDELLTGGRLSDWKVGTGEYLIVVGVAWLGEVGNDFWIEFRRETAPSARDLVGVLDACPVIFDEIVGAVAFEREVWHVVSDETRDFEVA